MLGDTKASWDLLALGIPLYFMPQAIVVHHHTSTVGDLLAERYQRGYEFAQLRISYFGWGVQQIRTTLALSVLPIRLVKLYLRTILYAWRARMVAPSLLSTPIIIAGHAAWLAGEVRCYLRALRTGAL
jgi:GT2 family glycosyltransferase